MNRRDMLTAMGAGLMIFAPKYGRFFREGAGLVQPVETVNLITLADVDFGAIMKEMYKSYRETMFPVMSPLLAEMTRGRGGRYYRWEAPDTPLATATRG